MLMEGSKPENQSFCIYPEYFFIYSNGWLGNSSGTEPYNVENTESQKTW